VTHLRLELADIVRDAGPCFVERSRRWISWQHQKVLLAITRCRTAALGGHLSPAEIVVFSVPFSISQVRARNRGGFEISSPITSPPNL
jgi:hypothetical protein